MIWFYLMASFGITFILMRGDPTKRLRRFLKQKYWFAKKLLNCAFCTGFWAGALVSLFLSFFAIDISTLLLFPFASCGVSGMLFMMFRFLEEKIYQPNTRS